MSISTQTGPSPRDSAFLVLEDHARAYDHARKARIHAAIQARNAGLTHQQIADAYGVTEGAVRAMLKRAGDA